MKNPKNPKFKNPNWTQKFFKIPVSTNLLDLGKKIELFFPEF